MTGDRSNFRRCCDGQCLWYAGYKKKITITFLKFCVPLTVLLKRKYVNWDICKHFYQSNVHLNLFNDIYKYSWKY